MDNDQLDIDFKKAFKKANSMKIDIPIDLRLKFYAYYKRATLDNSFSYNPNDGIPIRNAFKVNALLQVKHLTKDQAKIEYIKLVEATIIKYKLNI